MDLEEWRERDFERDGLIARQIEKAYKEMSDIEDDSFTLGLAEILVRYLKERKEGIEDFGVTEDGPAGLFFIDFFCDVICFSKNITEKNAMVARFLSKIIIPSLSSFHDELNKEEGIEFLP